jgi:hypothetical protein
MATIEASIPAQATAGTAQDTVIGEAPFAGTVTEVSFYPETAVAAAASNIRTFRLVNKGQSGAGTTVIASRSTVTSNSMVAYDEWTVTLSATAADLVVAAGDVLIFDETIGASGVAHGGGVVKVQITA